MFPLGLVCLLSLALCHVPRAEHAELQLALFGLIVYNFNVKDTFRIMYHG